MPLNLMSEGEITVRVMVPDGYENSSKRYPVVYIHDGQDVFEDKDIIWGDCSLDYLNYYQSYKTYLPELIIVALTCPKDRGERTALYTPFILKDGERSGVSAIHGKGVQYGEWIVHTLKPNVDSLYRTISDASHTAVLGYSTGGLISIYLAFKYPEVFHRFAALSSAVALWRKPLSEFFSTAEGAHIERIYMDVGTNEFGRFTKKEEFVEGAQWLYDTYLAKGISADKIKYNIYPGAIHSQICWKLRFPDALRWLFMKE